MTDYPCGYPEEMLSSLADGQLDPAEQRQLAVHVASCPRCAQTLGGLVAARAAVSVPRPERFMLPRAFWSGVRSRLDQVDSLIRATNVSPKRRPVLSRPAAAIALAALAVFCVGRAWFLMRPDVLTQVAQMHVSATAMPGDSGLHRTVGYGVHTRWQPVTRSLVSLGGTMVLQTIYEVDGLPVSVFRLPEANLNRSQLAPVQVGAVTFYMGVFDKSSLAAAPVPGGWDVIIARTPPDDLIRLAAVRPREIQLSPGF